jgi:uncharacterized membrane protein
MTWAHVHLALNHVPVIGILFIVLLLGTAVVRGSSELARASYGLIALVAVIAVAVYFTGEPAEELVEKLPGFSESLLDTHEDAALVATVGMSLLGLAAIFGLVRRQPAWYPKAVLALSLLVLVLMGWTANLGGQIRHTEIRSAAAKAGTTGERDNETFAPPSWSLHAGGGSVWV